MVNNGSLHYDHDRDGTHTQVAGCEAAFRNKDHETLISVRYTEQSLTVSPMFNKKMFSDYGVFLFKICMVIYGITTSTTYFCTYFPRHANNNL